MYDSRMITDTPPYGPPDQVIKVLERYRETGLGGGPLTTAQLTRLSMGDEVARRVLMSLKILDLVDDEGTPTDQMVALKKASSEAYKPLLAALLFDQYRDVFGVLGRDIAGKPPSEIEDAFRTFRPDSLRKRQVSLFLNLCAYANIIPDFPKDKPGPRPAPEATRPAPVRRRRREILPPPPVPQTPAPPDGRAARATLASGGHVLLSVSVDVLELSPADRQFVFDLIDRVKGYGQRPALPPGNSVPEVSAS